MDSELHSANVIYRKKKRRIRQKIIVTAVVGVAAVCSLHAQHFINEPTGTISNQGAIRVRGDASGLRDSIGGTFDYFGLNQSVSGTRYRHLLLGGTGTKRADSGSLAVVDSVRINGGVTFDVRRSPSFDLFGSIMEQGTLLGGIRATVELAALNGTNTFGGIGATVAWSALPPGRTTVIRVSGDTSRGNGTRSILRSYDLRAAKDTGLTVTLLLNYGTNELAGQNPNTLELWRSPDNGTSWRRQQAVVNTVQRTVTKSLPLILNGLWTFADSSHRLGPLSYEGVTADLVAIAGNNQDESPGTVLDTLVTRVSDFFGNPLRGVMVGFSLSQVPNGTLGAALSRTSVLTNTAGEASTILTLGEKTGVYQVTASAAGFLRVFTARSSVVVGDANNDKDLNIGDLTALVDYVSGRVVPSAFDRLRADANKDGLVDMNDVRLIRDSLLAGTQLGIISSRPPARLSKTTAPNFAALLEITETGVRFNLMNDVPVKGVQWYVRLTRPVSVQATDVVFRRGRQDSVYVKSTGNEIRVLNYSAENVELDTGSTSLFRLPIVLSSMNEIDSVSVFVSYGLGNSVLKISGQRMVPQPSKYPTSYSLSQNYPNPFNPMTTIEFDVPDVQGRFMYIGVTVFNILGGKIRTLDVGEREGGHYTLTWDGRDEGGQPVASGVYLYRLVSNEFQSVKKMILVR